MRFHFHTYDILKHGARVRLGHLKGKHAEHWRKYRTGLRDTASLHRGMNGRTPIWYSHEGVFRREQFADEIINLRHSGWYSHHEGWCGKDGSGLVRGLVVRLPHGRFLAGYYVGDNDEHVYFPELFTDEEDAARMADEHARVIAEQMQDDSRKWDEARKLEEESEQARERLCECWALRNNPKFAALRDEARELCERIRAIRETLSTEYKEVL